MNKSLNFLKSLSAEEKKGIAKKCQISVGTLRQIYGGRHKPSVRLAISLDRCTKGKASKKELLPNVDWDFIVE